MILCVGSGLRRSRSMSVGLVSAAARGILPYARTTRPKAGDHRAAPAVISVRKSPDNRPGCAQHRLRPAQPPVDRRPGCGIPEQVIQTLKCSHHASNRRRLAAKASAWSRRGAMRPNDESAFARRHDQRPPVGTGAFGALAQAHRGELWPPALERRSWGVPVTTVPVERSRRARK